MASGLLNPRLGCLLEGGNSQHSRLGQGHRTPVVAAVWMGRMWQLMAVSLGCTCAFWDGPGLMELVLRAGCDRARKDWCGGELSACGARAPVPHSVGFWGLGFAAAPPLLHLVPLRHCPAPGGAAGGSSGCAGAAAGLSSDPLCLPARALSPHLAIRAAGGA